MIKVIVSKSFDSIKISGHAMYDEYGKDIVCASVSSIVTTTINAIVRLDSDSIKYEVNDGVCSSVLKHTDTTLKLLENLVDLLEDLKNSMKEKNINRKNVIQMVRAAILQKEKDNNIELDDTQIMEIISKEHKKREDSLEDYKKANREDLIAQIEEEINVLNEYLPKKMEKEELEKIISQIIEETGASSMKDMGKVMKLAKEKCGVAADGRYINEIVKKYLTKAN